MTSLFIKILSMSLTASYCILFVCVARLLLKKAPRIFSYLLWIVVAFRLICPISFESQFSLVGSDFVPDIEYEMAEKTGEIENDFEAYLLTSEFQINQTYLNDTAAIVQDSASTDFSSEQILEKRNLDLQAIFLEVVTYIWMIGTCVLASYGLFTYVRLQQKIKVYAKRISSYNLIDVWQVKGLDTPFVLGFFKAAIYLPEGLSEEDSLQCLAHEYTHIRRKDHLFKQMAFLLVCVYWFNPLVWMAFYLMTKDMEMSCDEVAIRSTSLEDRKAYSGTLLELSSTTKYFSGCPLAFGANSTKARIKHIMNYKRPSFWIVVLAVVLVGVCVFGLSTNPKTEAIQQVVQNSNTQENANIPVDNRPSVWENTPEETIENTVEQTAAIEEEVQKEAVFIRTDSGEIVNVKYIEEFSLLEESSKYHELYLDLEHTLEHITAKMTELNEEKIALTENQLSLQETLKLENLSEDKVIDFQKQLEELEAKLAETEILLNTLKKEREAIIANKDSLTQQIISAQTPEILEKFTNYINKPENNAFVTTCYRGEKVNLAMLLYDAGMMLDNASFAEGELDELNRENINKQEIMYHFTGEQIDRFLQEKMNLPLESVKYTEEVLNNLKQEWTYLEEFDTYTLSAKGDSKIQEFVCKEIAISYEGKLIIAYEAVDADGWIKSGQLEMVPKALDNQTMEPDDYYFTANEFTSGGYVDNVISNTSSAR